MTLEFLEQLRDGRVGIVADVIDPAFAELVDLAIVGFKKRQQTRDSVAKVRGRAGEGKVSQKRPGRPKKPLPQAVNTAAAVAEKLQTLKKLQPFPEGMGNNIRAVTKEECNVPGVKPPTLEDFNIKPASSALPKPFLSVLDRVKSPAQLKHDPAATQFKAAKKAKS